MKIENLVGRRFGRLKVLFRAENGTHGNVQWYCVCDCGGSITTQGGGLRAGRTKGCGCIRRERALAGVSARIHGEGGRTRPTAEYNIWRAMKARCYYTKHIGFKHYGERGIRVCQHWRDSFEAFLTDMGRRPTSQHSIDRIDNDGNYEPSNCRWATSAQQSRDKDFKALSRKGHAALAAKSPQERSERSRKAYVTRRANRQVSLAV